MTKLTTMRGHTNPINELEQALNGFFNIAPVFHNLEEVYTTGDQVRFAQREEGLTVQIDVPGVKKDDLDLKVDSERRDIYIEGKRTILTHDSQKTQTYNRSFSVGKEYDLNKIKFAYADGTLEVSVPRRKKEEYIKKYTI